jgi:hypothetical protein
MSVRSDIPTSVFTFFVGGSSIVPSGHRSFTCLCKSCKVANTCPQSSQLSISSSLSDMIRFCLVVNFRAFVSFTVWLSISFRFEGCGIGSTFGYLSSEGIDSDSASPLITFLISFNPIWGDKMSVLSRCDYAISGLKSSSKYPSGHGFFVSFQHRIGISGVYTSGQQGDLMPVHRRIKQHQVLAVECHVTRGFSLSEQILHDVYRGQGPVVRSFGNRSATRLSFLAAVIRSSRTMRLFTDVSK